MIQLGAVGGFQELVLDLAMLFRTWSGRTTSWQTFESRRIGVYWHHVKKHQRWLPQQEWCHCPAFFLNDEKKVGASTSIMMVFSVLPIKVSLTKASLTREDKIMLDDVSCINNYEWTRKTHFGLSNTILTRILTPSHQQSFIKAQPLSLIPSLNLIPQTTFTSREALVPSCAEDI